MLTRALAIADYKNNRVIPDRLLRKEHDHYIAIAERLLIAYRTGVGRTRRELHKAIHEIFAGQPDCPTRRIDAFAKLLDDAGEYEHDHRGRAAGLRREIFHLAAKMHPLVRAPDRQFPNEEAQSKTNIADWLGRPWQEIDNALFADIMEFQRLKSFVGYPSGLDLLARYNVAQVQVALFDAVSMTVWAAEDYKTILRYAKLAGLMHSIRVAASGQYEFRFDGPASALRSTRRYGVAMAKFLPALIACRGWRMHAVVRTRRRGWNVSLDLSSEDRLKSHLPPPEEFDSQVEADFARHWGIDKRDGWNLTREGEVLFEGQKVFVPDFVFRHDDGRSVLMEIVGFWTPEYLEAKAKTLRLFSKHRILLAVGPSAADGMSDLPPEAIRYKSRLRVKDVLDRLELR